MPSLKSEIVSGNLKVFKNDAKKFFFSPSNVFSVLKHLNLCPEFFHYVDGKRLDKKTKFHFKIHDVRSWETHNYKK